MKVASYRSRVLHAGMVVFHRQIQGPQLYRVVVEIERPRRIVDRHVVRPSDRVPIGALKKIVASTIEELCSDPTEILDARMEFHVDQARP